MLNWLPVRPRSFSKELSRALAIAFWSSLFMKYMQKTMGIMCQSSLRSKVLSSFEYSVLVPNWSALVLTSGTSETFSTSSVCSA